MRLNLMLMLKRNARLWWTAEMRRSTTGWMVVELQTKWKYKEMSWSIVKWLWKAMLCSHGLCQCSRSLQEKIYNTNQSIQIYLKTLTNKTNHKMSINKNILPIWLGLPLSSRFNRDCRLDIRSASIPFHRVWVISEYVEASISSGKTKRIRSSHTLKARSTSFRSAGHLSRHLWWPKDTLKKRK